MYQLTSLNSEPKQEIPFLLSDNSRIIFYFEYKPNQLGWFFDFTYNGQSYKNIRLTTNYNILECFKPYIPFGVCCDTPDGEEPYDIDDFSTGYAKVYILTKEDIASIDANFYSKYGENLENA